MKYRLKKLYQTLITSFSAGTVKTLQEWCNAIPLLQGLTRPIDESFPDWFEKIIPELQLTTCAWRDGKIVYGRYGNDYDGYRLDKIKLDVTIETQEDIKQLMQYLNIHKHCFKDDPRHYPLSPSDCFIPSVLHDNNYNPVDKSCAVFTRYNCGDKIITTTAEFARKSGLPFFKYYTDASQHFNIKDMIRGV